MTGKLVQVNVSKGGMPKLAVPAARVTVDGVEGDWQKNRKYHGGRDRAVCLFSVELYDRLRSLGIDLGHGAVGENLKVEGVDFKVLGKGVRLRGEKDNHQPELR
jgi:MOSC domain-containing protein YiiM